MAAICFLDCEFTDLLSPDLLSLGLVTHHGIEQYVELDMQSDAGKARKKASSDFVKFGGVLDLFGLFPACVCTPWEMGRRAGEWLLSFAESAGTRVEVAFDYAVDYELMEYAIRDCGLWDRVREVVRPVNIGRLTGTIEGELAAEECFRELSKHKPPLSRHHALADAWALRHSYLAAKRAALEIAQKGAGPREALGISSIEVIDGLISVLEQRRLRQVVQAPLAQIVQAPLGQTVQQAVGQIGEPREAES